MEKLSVVIPTFKRSFSLEKLLQKLFDQRDVELEIIVIDQNVPDFFSGNILQLLKKVIWVHLENPNASTARNLGFQQATADYILFIDDDLVPDSLFCKKGIEIFLAYRDIHCFSPLVYNHEGKELALSYANFKFIKSHENNPKIFAITDTMSAAFFITREYFKKSGGFDEILFSFAKTAEDQEFFLRMNKLGLILWHVSSLEIYHEELVDGGCELRSSDYWTTRKRCIRAWVYRYRSHNHESGSISFGDYFRLCRSVFLNKEVLTGGITNIKKQIGLMNEAVTESKSFFRQHMISDKKPA